MNYSAEKGEAAFYGPKIDFMVSDCIGREWQLGTVQVDYTLPKRFDVEYTGADNRPHRPVMIHRAPFGSMERFIGVLIEHFAGEFPLWLAPVQAIVLSISDKSNDYANEVLNALQTAGLRVESNLGSEKINAKVRAAVMDKIPYLVVVGERDAAGKTISVRTKSAEQGAMSVQEFINRCTQEIVTRGQTPATAGITA